MAETFLAIPKQNSHGRSFCFARHKEPEYRTNFTTSTNSLTLGDQLDISISFDEEMDTNQIIQFEYDPIITSPM